GPAGFSGIAILRCAAAPFRLPVAPRKSRVTGAGRIFLLPIFRDGAVMIGEWRQWIGQATSDDGHLVCAGWPNGRPERATDSEWPVRMPGTGVAAWHGVAQTCLQRVTGCGSRQPLLANQFVDQGRQVSLRQGVATGQAMRN